MHLPSPFTQYISGLRLCMFHQNCGETNMTIRRLRCNALREREIRRMPIYLPRDFHLSFKFFCRRWVGGGDATVNMCIIVWGASAEKLFHCFERIMQ